MNVIELRNKLNKLIEDGKGDYLIIDNTEGLILLNGIKEGFITERINDYGAKKKYFHLLEDHHNIPNNTINAITFTIGKGDI